MATEVPYKGLEWTNLVLGACLASSAFLYREVPTAAWDAGVAGSIMVCLSIVALYRYNAVAEWSNLGLGLWVAAAPFMLGFGSHGVALWAHVVLGLSVASIAGLQLMADSKSQGSSKSGSTWPE